MMGLLDFCRFSIRLNASRRIAWRSWHRYQPSTSWEEFCTFWASARALETQHPVEK